MVRKTKEEAAETRSRLLDTAEEVFLREGVTRTSLQRIAEAAGLTRGAIYWHFQDKVDLFNAMMERVCLPCEEACMLDTQADAAQALREFARQPLERMMEDERTRRVFTIAIHRTEYSEEMRAAFERHLEAMEEFRTQAEAIVRRGQAEGRFETRLDSRAASVAMIALIDGLLSRATSAPDGPDGVRDAFAAIDLFVAGLTPRPAAGACGSCR